MSNAKYFTPEEMEVLAANPYTDSVTYNMLRHTRAFKQYALKASDAGKKPSEIYRDAGYDPQMVGTQRMRHAIKKFREQANSPKGLQLSPNEKKATELQSKNKSMKDLQNRISYLEDEVELLKKSLEFKMKYLKKDE